MPFDCANRFRAKINDVTFASGCYVETRERSAGPRFPACRAYKTGSHPVIRSSFANQPVCHQPLCETSSETYLLSQDDNGKRCQIVSCLQRCVRSRRDHRPQNYIRVSVMPSRSKQQLRNVHSSRQNSWDPPACHRHTQEARRAPSTLEKAACFLTDSFTTEGARKNQCGRAAPTCSTEVLLTAS